MATIGLCMIVKNEAHVIRRCLDSVRPLVDFVLVEDTGSSDGTQEVVRGWLRESGVRGLVVEEAWRDFAWNRTRALALLRAQDWVDYALIIDADDTLGFEPGFDAAAFKAGLVADQLDVEIRHGGIRYHRPQLCRNAMAFRYRGVLHEFLEGPAQARQEIAAGLFMRFGADGARSREAGKYARDAAVLEQALGEEGDAFLRARYTFYLAQSWRDAGRPERALPRYLERAEQGFWQEEVYYSLYQAARMMEALGQAEETVIAAYLRAASVLPGRVEALHAASRFCRMKGRNEEGWRIAARGLGIAAPASGLFVEHWVHRYGMRDEYAVNAYWCGRYAECLEACLDILELGDLEAGLRRRVAANARFAAEKLTARPESVAGRRVPGAGETVALREVLGFLRNREAGREAPPFPPVLVINLDHRTDRWARIAGQCERLGLAYERVPALRDAQGWIGCGRSHRRCIEIAKERGLPWVLILEDDCEFDADGIALFRSLLPRLWSRRGEWERFSGGPHFGTGRFEPELRLFDHDFHLFRMRGLGNHFDLINSSAYDAILAYDPMTDREIDVFYLNAAGRLDAPIRSICGYPHIGRQGAGPSDITPETAEKMPLMAAYSAGKLLEAIKQQAFLPDEVFRVPARHPHWSGELLLSRSGDVLQFGAGNFGRYRIIGRELIVGWYLYQTEIFELNADDTCFVFKTNEVVAHLTALVNE